MQSNSTASSEQDSETSPTGSVDQELIAIGAALRNIRRQKGFTLRDVERESSGRWKAVVVGSYERGDRALTLKRAVALARFYEVPLDQLLGLPKTAQSSPTPLTFALTKVRSQEQSLPSALLRYIREICRRRSDWNGEVLSIRDGDLMALAIIFDMSEEDLLSWLGENEILLH